MLKPFSCGDWRTVRVLILHPLVAGCWSLLQVRATKVLRILKCRYSFYWVYESLKHWFSSVESSITQYSTSLLRIAQSALMLYHTDEENYSRYCTSAIDWMRSHSSNNADLSWGQRRKPLKSADVVFYREWELFSVPDWKQASLKLTIEHM